MLKMILMGMGGFFVLIALLLLLWEMRKSSRVVQTKGVIIDTGRDMETTHDSWAKVQIIQEDGTARIYMAQGRGQFMDEHLNQEVTVLIDPNKKQRGSMMSRCYIDDGRAINRPGITRILIPVVLFAIIGAAMLVAGLKAS